MLVNLSVFFFFVFLALGIAGFLCLVGSNRIKKFFGPIALISISATFLVTSITSLLANIDAKRVAESIIRASDKGLADLSEDKLILALQEAAGRPEIAEVVAHTVLNSDDFYITNSTYEATLERPIDPALSEYERSNYFMITATQTQMVHNPSSRSQEYHFSSQHFALDSPSENVDRIVYEELRIVLLDGDNQVVGDTLRILRTQLLQHVSSAGDLSKLVPPPPRIQPKHKANVYLRTRSYEPMDRGQIAFLAARKSVNMEISVAFPIRGFEMYDTAFFFVHRGQQEASMADNFTTLRDPASGRVSAKIKGGILPLNGAILNWTQRADST